MADRINIPFHGDRLGTIGALTAAIVHEINQPLAAILSNAQAALQLLTMDPPDFEEIRQILDDIVEDDKRASDIIQNLRSLLKKDTIRKDPCDLNELIARMIRLIASEAIIRDIGIEKDLSPSLPQVSGDPVQIQQVILNLLLNAMDANRTESADRRITVSTETRNGWIFVHISDTGPGIPEQMRQTLFKPFYTTKEDGIGIGLTICQSIIESHGGTLSARNRAEGGARFTFRLPARRE